MIIMVITLIKNLNYMPCNIIFLTVSMYKERNKTFQVCTGQKSNNNNDDDDDDDIYTGGDLTLSGFRNGPVKNIIKT